MSGNLDLIIDNYISDEYSICREERQYALYLSNVLRYYGKNPNYDENHKDVPANRIDNNEKVKEVFEACGFNKENGFDNLDNLIVDNVYYEATFMRDFFERNRRLHLSDPSRTEIVCKQKTFTPSSYIIRDKGESFNRKLIEFCLNTDDKTNEIEKESLKKCLKGEDISEIHYGMKNGNKKIPLRFKKYKNKIRAMMNSKPDLAVFYKNKSDEKRYLLFLECKFYSDEDAIEDDNGNKLSQTKIQGYIAEFLGRYYFTDSSDISVSSIMNPENSREYCSKIVRFIREEQENTKDGDNEAKPIPISIDIKNLIDLESKIFNKENE